MHSENRITKIFNLTLFLYFLANIQVGIWLEPETKEALPWDQMFQGMPSYFSLLALLVVGVLLLVWGSLLIKFFWNAFLSGIFKIRQINLDEAIALALILTLLSGL